MRDKILTFMRENILLFCAIIVIIVLSFALFAKAADAAPLGMKNPATLLAFDHITINI